MPPLRWLIPLALLTLAAGPLARWPFAAPSTELLTLPGFPEPHTPGAPGVVASAAVRSILGEAPDLNTVTVRRTFQPRPPGLPPRVIWIAIPGFLAGATTFGPLAHQMVAAFDGELEVWAVERRPNQLEDRRGARHAAAGTSQALLEGAQFYFPDVDVPPLENFPGPEDFDVDGDGTLDPPFTLPDALGGERPFVRLAQDDVRFMAHWGVDAYVRDWKRLVERARAIVGEQGLVLFGGHSQGTTWSALFAAYDFDPGPGVEAGHTLIDGLVLLEGGGARLGASPPTRAEYLEAVAALESPGGPDVYLANAFGLLPVRELGAAGELAGLAGVFEPDAPALVQRTSFNAILGIIIQAPVTNRSGVAFFLDDDFTPTTVFRTSLGFSDDGLNFFAEAVDAYIPFDEGRVRRWKRFDDPTLPSCPPNVREISPGCAVLDNGPKPGPGEAPRVWGREREVTDLDETLPLLFTDGNLSEWYFGDGRLALDFRFGRDASALGDDALLAVTQNAGVDVPVIAIGASNGLAPTEASFADYLGSIATPAAEQRVAILEGYAHFDVMTAAENDATPILAEWVRELLGRKQTGRRPPVPGPPGPPTR